MSERLAFMWPEIALFITTCVVMVMGLSRSYGTRKATAFVAGLGLLAALWLSMATTPGSTAASCPISGAVLGGAVGPSGGQVLFPDMVAFAKCLVAIVGLLLLLVMAGTVDRAEEAAIRSGARGFDPLRSNRAEFYAFFLFSLTGLMLTASADDLVWLFLALELTSLPTYIMVTISTPRNQSREAGVKYFFLGALGAAIFLYGFALLYGATGTTRLNEMALHFAAQGISPLAMAGMLLAILGLGFKIAAVPMHFYTADVYQGAAPQVSAFLAFVPKAAGFFALILLLGTVGWKYAAPATADGVFVASPDGAGLPEPLRVALWVLAALTMTVGNVLAVLQSSVKRMLAYSSIAHTGYMLVGLVVGPRVTTDVSGEVVAGRFTDNGIAAVLFYLLAYGVMNLGAFAALAAVERRPGRDGEPREIDHIDDIRGLCKRHAVAGWCLVLSSLSLLGLPPLLGFFGKLPLFTSAIGAGEIVLVVVLGLNSAIAAYYYLRLAFLPFTDAPDQLVEPSQDSPFSARRVAALASAGGVVALAIVGGPLMQQAEKAALPRAIVVETPGARPALGTQSEADATGTSRPGTPADSPSPSTPALGR